MLGLDHDPRTKRFVLVLEDLQARGCTFTELVDALTVPQATAGLDTLARLHGSQWRNPRLGRAASGAGGPQAGLGWVRANGADPLLALFALMAERLRARIATTNPELVTDHGRAIVAALPGRCRHPRCRSPHRPARRSAPRQLVRRRRPGGVARLAGRPAGEPAARRRVLPGAGPRSRPVRRAHERSLLEGYRRRARGRRRSRARRRRRLDPYRSMAAYPFVAATFTAGFGGLQDDRTALEGLRRAAAAIEDLDAADASGAARRWPHPTPRLVSRPTPRPVGDRRARDGTSGAHRSA